MKATPLRRFGYWLYVVVFRLLLKLEVVGREHIPAGGPLIVACNHATFLDPFMIDAVVGRPMVFFAKEEVMSIPVFGFLARYYMVIPVARGEADTSALKGALRTLREGYALYVAPEGTRGHTGALQHGKVGAVVMAQRTGAAVVPCGVSGQKELGRHLKRLRRAPVRVQFGPAFQFVGPRKPSKEELQAMADEMMYRIAALLPAEQRGVYAGPPPAFRYTVELDEAQPATRRAN